MFYLAIYTLVDLITTQMLIYISMPQRKSNKSHLGGTDEGLYSIWNELGKKPLHPKMEVLYKMKTWTFTSFLQRRNSMEKLQEAD